MTQCSVVAKSLAVCGAAWVANKMGHEIKYHLMDLEADKLNSCNLKATTAVGCKVLEDGISTFCTLDQYMKADTEPCADFSIKREVYEGYGDILVPLVTVALLAYGLMHVLSRNPAPRNR